MHTNTFACSFCKVDAVYDKDLNCMCYPLGIDIIRRTDQDWRMDAENADKKKMVIKLGDCSQVL